MEFEHVENSRHAKKLNDRLRNMTRKIFEMTAQEAMNSKPIVKDPLEDFCLQASVIQKSCIHAAVQSMVSMLRAVNSQLGKPEDVGVEEIPRMMEVYCAEVVGMIKKRSAKQTPIRSPGETENLH
jgi:hypothetical protein